MQGKIGCCLLLFSQTICWQQNLHSSNYTLSAYSVKLKKDIAKELEEAAKNNDPIEESGSIEPDANAETKEA